MGTSAHQKIPTPGRGQQWGDLGHPRPPCGDAGGQPLPFDARQQGGTLTVTSDTLAARLHGTREALEALREQGVEQIQFVTTLKTTTLPVAELLAEGAAGLPWSTTAL